MRAALKALPDEACADGGLVRCDTGRLARAVQVMIGGSLLQWAIDRDGPAGRRVRDDLETLLRPLERRRSSSRRKRS